MTDKELVKLAKERERLLSNSNSSFLKRIEKIQGQIATIVIKELEKFNRKNGRLSSSSDDRKILLRIDKLLRRIFKSANLGKEAKSVLAGFKKLEDVNRSLYSNVLQKKVKLPININKSLLIDEVIDSFKDDVINSLFLNPLKKILYNAVKFEQTFTEAKAAVENAIKGTRGIRSYASVTTRDLLNRYDGSINDKIQEEFQLDGFMYVGSLVDDSRDNCEDLINGTGVFAQFAIRPGVYLVRDIPAIIKAARKGKGSGYNDALTVGNFAAIRMGWNCRHQVIYVPLLEEENPERLKLIQQL